MRIEFNKKLLPCPYLNDYIHHDSSYRIFTAPSFYKRASLDVMYATGLRNVTIVSINQDSSSRVNDYGIVYTHCSPLDLAMA